MKLAPKTLVENFPPKLRELALKRTFEINGTERELALEKKVNACFSWHASPEGYNFWSNVHNGKEFEWEEEAPEEGKWNGKFPFPAKWYVIWEKQGDEQETNAHFKHFMGYVNDGVIDYKGGWRGGVGSTYKIREEEIQISMDQFRKYVVKKAPVKEESKEKLYWAVRITPENKEILGGWRTSGLLSVGTQGFCLCPNHPQGGEGTRGYHVNSLPEDCVEISTEEFKRRESIVSTIKPQAATQTAYVSSPGVEPFLSKCGKYISATNPYANPCVDMSWGINPYVYKSRRTGGTKAYTEKISKYIEAYMGRTPYFRETSEEVNDELREWMGIKSAKKLAGNGVEKLPSAILIYKKEKVKRKLI